MKVDLQITSPTDYRTVVFLDSHHKDLDWHYFRGIQFFIKEEMIDHIIKAEAKRMGVVEGRLEQVIPLWLSEYEDCISLDLVPRILYFYACLLLHEKHQSSGVIFLNPKVKRQFQSVVDGDKPFTIKPLAYTIYGYEDDEQEVLLLTRPFQSIAFNHVKEAA